MSEAREVALESVNFVLTHIHAGHEAEWNDYYENDHFYAGGVLAPGVLSGRRWYAPRRLRDVRFASQDCPFPDASAGQAAATYFLTAPRGGDEFLEWIPPQVEALDRQGRMFRHRDVVNVALYTYAGFAPGSEGRMSPHVTQEHPWTALFVTMARGEHASAAPAPSARSITMRFKPRPDLLLAEHAVQPTLTAQEPTWLLLTFTKDQPPADSPSTAALATAVAASCGARPLWGATFLLVTPGDAGFLRDL